ncbi:hypothetical protein JB92DRAFT_3118508 [Gautieria morchelliformis]|nr:hypothetical protein JB92DRAFT_3118508 [Gautieria morchelliformis]
MSGITNNSRPKRRITATEKVTNPCNVSIPALASHAAAKHLAAAKLPSAPLPESICEPAAEEGSAGNSSQTGETTEDNSSSYVNKRKTLDIVELTDSELAPAREKSPVSRLEAPKPSIIRNKGMHHKSAVDPIDVDADNVLTDIDIVYLSAAPSTKTIRKDANCDLGEFFQEPAAVTGKDGKVQKCHVIKTHLQELPPASAKVALRATSLKLFNASNIGF